MKASTEHTAKCGKGYFCKGPATTTTPTDICKDFDPATSICTLPASKNTCADGTFDLSTLECSTGVCKEGTYDSANKQCTGVTTIQAVCPKGFYCEEGTSVPTACDDGYFSTSYGAQDDSLCIICTEGFYCSSFEAREKCPAGYHCPEGTSDYDQTALKAEAGYFTQEGFTEQVACLPGEYQNDIQ